MLEELVPKPTGREAMIEKRKERGAAAREGAAAKYDTTMDFDDSDLMGSGGEAEFKALYAMPHVALLRCSRVPLS